MFAIALLGLLGIGLVVDLVGSDDDDQETADVIDCNAIEAESGTTVDTNETDFIAGGDGKIGFLGVTVTMTSTVKLETTLFAEALMMII